jgi:type VI secretion system FHA domain protein
MSLTLTLFDPTALAGGPTTVRRFEQPRVTIGRAPDNDWALTDPRAHLSEHHCLIEHDPEGGFRLTDTSTTGVFLNESPAPLGAGNHAPLGPGDRIALGDYLIAVGRGDERESAPTRESVAKAVAEAIAPPAIEPAVEPVFGHTEGPTDGPRATPDDRLPVSGRGARAPMREQRAAAAPAPSATPEAPTRERRGTRIGRAANRRTRDRDEAAEVVQAFLAGAGIAASELPRERAQALLRAGGAALREAVTGAQDVLRLRLQLARGAPLDRAQLRASADNPLTGGADAPDALRQLLGVDQPPRLPPDQAVRELIAEIAHRGPAASDGGAARRRVGALAVGTLVAGLLIGGAASWLALNRATEPATVVASVPPPVVAPPPVAPAPPPEPPAPAAQPAAPPIPAVLPAIPPPTIDKRQLRDELAQLFRSFVCADLSGEIDDDGTVTLAGFVSRGDELPRLHREVTALKQVARVDSRATVEPWPFCEVRNLLRTQTAGGPTAPQIEPSHADRIYHEGEALIVSATANAKGESYLYVDFFDTDGRVVHMLPTTLRPNNRLGANERIALGAPPDKAGRNDRVYIISPPFGTGLVIAVSSLRPLFTEARPEQEDARSYLAALAGALVRDPVGAGSAARITSSQQSITLVAR